MSSLLFPILTYFPDLFASATSQLLCSVQSDNLPCWKQTAPDALPALPPCGDFPCDLSGTRRDSWVLGSSPSLASASHAAPCTRAITFGTFSLKARSLICRSERDAQHSNAGPPPEKDMLLGWKQKTKGPVFIVPLCKVHGYYWSCKGFLFFFLGGEVILYAWNFML